MSKTTSERLIEAPPEARETDPRPGQNIAEFMERRGRRIVETAECLWHSVESRFFLSLPYHVPRDPESAEISRLLVAERGLGVRFLSRNRPGLAGGIYVWRRKPYGLDCIHQKLRSQVRRGLEKFTVRPVEQSELLAQGIQLNRDTMTRQGRYDAEFGEPGNWERLASAVYQSRGVMAYGAFSEGRLAAYVIACRDGGWLHILHQMSRTEDLPQNPNHAVTFSVTAMAGEDPTLEAASYGLVSLLSADGLHMYKVRFGYEVVEGASAFQFHPALAPVLRNGVLRGAVGLLRRIRPQDQRLEKVETVLEAARLSARPVRRDVAGAAVPLEKTTGRLT
jgi:hypothetical protein